MSDIIKLRAEDEHAFDAYVARPEGTPKAAVVVLQEIFGVNHHIQSITDRFAAEGYLAVAPALFDRYQRDFKVGYDPAGWETAMSLLPGLNMDWTAADTLAAIAYAREESGTKVGVVGFCLGGSVAWMAAARMPIDAAVGYYGGTIAQAKDMTLQAPVVLHFGSHDAHIPVSDVEAIKAAHPEVPVYLYQAGHGFNCDERESYSPQAAAEAWSRPVAFLREHLGGAAA